MFTWLLWALLDATSPSFKRHQDETTGHSGATPRGSVRRPLPRVDRKPQDWRQRGGSGRPRRVWPGLRADDPESDPGQGSGR